MFRNLVFYRHRATAVAFLALCLSWPASQAHAQFGDASTLASAVPPGALAFAEFNGLDRLIDRLQNSELLSTILDSPAYDGFRASKQYDRFEAGKRLLENQFGTDLWTAGKDLFGKRIALAVYPKPTGRQPDAVAILRVEKPAVLKRVVEQVESLLILADAERVDTEEVVAGKRVVSVNGQVFFCMGGDWLAVASSKSLLSVTVGNLEGKAGKSLADDEAFAGVAQRLGKDQLLRAFVRPKLLAERNGKRVAPAKLDNALVSLVIGGIYEWALRSDAAGLSITLEDDRFAVTASASGSAAGLGERYAGFFSNPEQSGTRPIPTPTSVIGGFTLYRDLADLYQRREELLVERVLPGFDKFEAGLGNVLPNKDFGQDVLPLFGKTLTFVAARQDYSSLGGEPGVKLPGFALIADLSKPDEAEKLFQLLFQSIVAISNITAGQNGGIPMVLTGEQYKGAMISYGQRLAKATGENLPTIFNFTPAAARVNDKFVMSSSVDLCRGLIEQLQSPREERGQPENRNLALSVFGSSLADILDDNRKLLQARMIQGGRDAERAQTEFDTILKTIRSIREASLTTSVDSDALELKLEVRLP